MENELKLNANWNIVRMSRPEVFAECLQDWREEADGNVMMENIGESVVSPLVCGGLSLSQSSYFSSSGGLARSLCVDLDTFSVVVLMMVFHVLIAPHEVSAVFFEEQLVLLSLLPISKDCRPLSECIRSVQVFWNQMVFGEP